MMFKQNVVSARPVIQDLGATYSKHESPQWDARPVTEKPPPALTLRAFLRVIL
jgi:hypothetical protein